MSIRSGRLKPEHVREAAAKGTREAGAERCDLGIEETVMETEPFADFSSVVKPEGEKVAVVTFSASDYDDWRPIPEQSFPGLIEVIAAADVPRREARAQPDRGTAGGSEEPLGGAPPPGAQPPDPRKRADWKDVGLSYIVYRAASDPYRVRYSLGHGQRDTSKVFNKLWAHAANMAQQGAHKLTKKQRRDLALQIGSAVSSGLEGDDSGMQYGLNTANKYLWDISRRRGRVPYMRSLIGFVLVIGVAGILLALDMCATNASCDCGSNCSDWMTILTASLIGGALGLIVFAGASDSQPFDPFASTAYNVTEGILRGVFGIAGALAVAIIVASGAITTELIEPGENELLVLTVFAIAGGYSQNYAVSLLRSFSPVDIPPEKRTGYSLVEIDEA